jgi:hypothetical protein
VRILGPARSAGESDVSDFNPYEAPKAEVAPSSGFRETGAGLWRNGSLLVMRKDAWLPDRCVKCNAPAEARRLRRNLSWHAPGWYILVLFNVLIYLIAALIVRKTARIEIGLCQGHWFRRRRAIAVGWVAVLAGMGMFFYGLSTAEPGMSLVGGLVAFFGLITGVVGSQTVVATRIDETYAWLKKVHPAFLAELPDWGDFGPPPGRLKALGIDKDNL